jgi:hypothetical protein
VHRPSERLEPAQDDQDQAPSVPQRKGGVDEQFVGDGFLATGFRGFDGIVDLGDGSADEEGEDEGGDVPCSPEKDNVRRKRGRTRRRYDTSTRYAQTGGTKETVAQLDGISVKEPGLTVLVPQPHERLVQHREEGEPPLDGIHEHLFAPFGELVEHQEEEEEVDLFVIFGEEMRRRSGGGVGV